MLAQDGWSVTALVRDVRAAEVAFANVPEVSVRRGDVTDGDSLADVAQSLGDAGLDLLVANAATFAPWDQTVGNADIDDVREVIEVNVVGTWRTLQAFLPALRRAAHAEVIVVGSGGGSHGDPDFGIATSAGAAAYATSKAAVHAMARKLSAELASEGIDVFVVDPGLTATAPGMAEFGARPPADGAASILWPALHRGDIPPGSFTRDGAPLSW
jgi:NAD(P)-dependent dehydrogenase (short-subunit alcohol dehydrogenase family)